LHGNARAKLFLETSSQREAETMAPGRDGSGHIIDSTVPTPPPYDPGEVPERRRGLFNFLTWPFFMAQLFAAEQFMSGMLRPARAEEEPSKTTRPEDADRTGASESNAFAQRVGGPEDGTAPPPAGPLAAMAEAQLPPGPEDAKATGEDAPSGKAAAANSSSGGSASGGGSSSDQSYSDEGNTAAPVKAGNGVAGATHSGTSPELLGQDGPSTDLAKLLGVTTAPLGISGVEALRPLLDATNNIAGTPVIQPIVSAIDPILGAAPGVVDDVAGALAPLDEGVEAVTGTATQAVSALLQAAGSGATPALKILDGQLDGVMGAASGASDVVNAIVPATLVPSSVPEILDTLVSSTVQQTSAIPETLAKTVADVSGSTIETAVSLPSELIESVAKTATAPLLASPSLTPDLALNDTIAFDENLSFAKHELFANGQYTDYGVAMQSEPVAAPAQLARDNVNAIPETLEDIDPPATRSDDRARPDDPQTSNSPITPVAQDLAHTLDDIARPTDHLL
jgi:hypothetical protein